MGLCTPIRPLTIVGLFMWFLISILLIAAAGSTKWISIQGAQGGGFQYCTTGSGGTCYNIDTNCNIDGNPGFDNCSKFQAFRASATHTHSSALYPTHASPVSDRRCCAVLRFLIMGLLTALFTTILAFTMFFMHLMRSTPLLIVYHALAAMTWLFELIAWSVFAGWAGDVSLGNGSLSSSKSDGFGLCVSAWVFIFVAWPAFAAACMFEEEGTASSLGTGSSMGGKSTDAGATAGAMQMQPQQQQGAPLPYQAQPQQAAPMQHSYQVPPPVLATAGYPYAGQPATGETSAV